MVKLGSGGAVFAADGMNDQDYILNRLPVAQANHYIQVFWMLQRDPLTGRGFRCVKSYGNPLTRQVI